MKNDEGPLKFQGMGPNGPWDFLLKFKTLWAALQIRRESENQQGFFPGGTGGPPSGENFANPPIRHLSPFLDQSLSPPPSRGSSPKIWKI